MMVWRAAMEHDETCMAHGPPRQADDIAWTFTPPGRFEFAASSPATDGVA